MIVHICTSTTCVPEFHQHLVSLFFFFLQILAMLVGVRRYSIAATICFSSEDTCNEWAQEPPLSDFFQLEATLRRECLG